MSTETKIIVNAREKAVEGTAITFDEVVQLAALQASGTGVIYTITYKKGPSTNPEGAMVAGDSVSIKEGMIFNVTSTSKS